jgi:hypothetical protein
VDGNAHYLSLPLRALQKYIYVKTTTAPAVLPAALLPCPVHFSTSTTSSATLLLPTSQPVTPTIPTAPTRSPILVA